MDKIKNSFALGIVLGLALSAILLVVMDATVYVIYRMNGKRLLEADVIFAICILASLVLARIYSRKEGKQELGKGFLFASFIWGAIYVFLFYISPIKTLFFAS